MSRKADIWMPIYIGDYLADTTLLSTEQHGAYLLMLMAYWKTGPLPDNDEVLANVTRLPVDRWLKTRGLLLGFFSVNDGFWFNKRADEEKAKADAFLAKQRANGAKGGRPKNPNITQEKPMGLPNINPNESPSQSPSYKEKDMSSGDDGEKVKQVRVDYEMVFNAYEEVLSVPPFNRPKVRIRDDKRKAAIKKIVSHTAKATSKDWWVGYFGIASENDHWMRGDKHKSGTWDGANFDFLLRDDIFKKIAEGNV